MEKIPYVAAVFALLTILAAILIPLFYTRKVRVKGKRRIRVLSKFNRQIIVGVFSYFMGIFAIVCTPVLIPFVEKMTNGNQQYPLIATLVVALLLLVYATVEYLIITFASKLMAKRISSGR